MEPTTVMVQSFSLSLCRLKPNMRGIIELNSCSIIVHALALDAPLMTILLIAMCAFSSHEFQHLLRVRDHQGWFELTHPFSD
ncbi:hypothetical protein VNO78_07235 [Psophocarpus tetragonolobus]|uniref:Uncharacterized protein n=1 Tax=Psophocarpus tetragonolobus TaxID=3891 RepID=A0AAN9ST04_PSOTE